MNPFFFVVNYYFLFYDKYNEYPICKDSRDHWNIVGWRADGEASVPVKFEWWACGKLHGREERCSESLTAHEKIHMFIIWGQLVKKTFLNYYWLYSVFCTVQLWPTLQSCVTAQKITHPNISLLNFQNLFDLKNNQMPEVYTVIHQLMTPPPPNDTLL